MPCPSLLAAGRSRCLDAFPAGFSAGLVGGCWTPAGRESISWAGNLPTPLPALPPNSKLWSSEDTGPVTGFQHLHGTSSVCRSHSWGPEGGGGSVCFSWEIFRGVEGEAVEQCCQVSLGGCVPPRPHQLGTGLSTESMGWTLPWGH